ncbi:hypothetical protein ENTCAN_07660 [Enterobacter cancerogenus ATCC 35316]|nr:hypothetical protein ENTCAN_07660 [Enterobacter cancerogenus ATCC 35316]
MWDVLSSGYLIKSDKSRVNFNCRIFILYDSRPAHFFARRERIFS